MTDKELIKEIVRKVKTMGWREIASHGINAQQAQKIKRGQPIRFYAKSLARLRKLFDKTS